MPRRSIPTPRDQISRPAVRRISGFGEDACAKESLRQHTQLPLGWMIDLAVAGPTFVSRPVADAADVIQSG
jgi:hypothetical protein